MTSSLDAKDTKVTDQQIQSIGSVDLNVVDMNGHDLNVVGVRDDLIIADGEKDVSLAVSYCPR